MPRTACETSQTGIYHAILRGVNKQQIFECHEDYQHFIQVLQRQCGMTAHKPSLDSPESHIPSCSEPPAKPMSKSFTSIWYAKIAPKTSFGTPMEFTLS